MVVTGWKRQTLVGDVNGVERGAKLDVTGARAGVGFSWGKHTLNFRSRSGLVSFKMLQYQASVTHRFVFKTPLADVSNTRPPPKDGKLACCTTWVNS